MYICIMHICVSARLMRRRFSTRINWTQKNKNPQTQNRCEEDVVMVQNFPLPGEGRGGKREGAGREVCDWRDGGGDGVFSFGVVVVVRVGVGERPACPPVGAAEVIEC